VDLLVLAARRFFLCTAHKNNEKSTVINKYSVNKTNTEVFIMTLTDLLNQAQNTPHRTDAEILEFRAQHPETDWAEQDREYAEILQMIRERMEEHRLKLLARRQERFRDFSGSEHK
jgi:hypothetical protein